MLTTLLLLLLAASYCWPADVKNDKNDENNISKSNPNENVGLITEGGIIVDSKPDSDLSLLPIPALLPVIRSKLWSKVKGQHTPAINDDPEQAIKDTTKIVTIKIYPPPLVNSINHNNNNNNNNNVVNVNNNETSSSKEPITVSIPKPFDGIDRVPKNIVEQKRSEGSLGGVHQHKTKDVSSLEFSSGELTNIDYSLLCRDGQPYLSEGKPLYCAVSSGCPVGYWCHTGSSKATTFCCPHSQPDSGCSLPVMSGYGTGQMERWHYDQFDSVCKLFVYTGYGGNQNNFLTSQDCADACVLAGPTDYSTDEQTGNPHSSNSAPDKTASYVTYQQQHYHSTDTPATFTEPIFIPKLVDVSYVPSSIVTLAPTVVIVQTTPFETSLTTTQRSQKFTPAPRCYEKGGIAGTGTAFATRWSYDPTLNECKSFLFAGYSGTNNNFYSEFECSYMCRGLSMNQGPTWTTPLPYNRCSLPYNKGTGYSPTLRWFYNSQVDECQQFTYMGYGGNENNFFDEEACRSICRTEENIEDDPCYMSVSYGNGTQNLTRYYYDFNTKECLIFVYSGNGGNKNNFASQEICRLNCAFEFGQSLEIPRQHPNVDFNPKFIQNPNYVFVNNPNLQPISTTSPSIAVAKSTNYPIRSGPPYVNITAIDVNSVPFINVPGTYNPNEPWIVPPIPNPIPLPNSHSVDIMPISHHTKTEIGPSLINTAIPQQPAVNSFPVNVNAPYNPVPNMLNLPHNPNLNPPYNPNYVGPVPSGIPPISPVPFYPVPIQQPNGANFVPDLQVDAGHAQPVMSNVGGNRFQNTQMTSIGNLNADNNRAEFVNVTSLNVANICNGAVPYGDIHLCGPENDFQCPPNFVCHIAVPFSLCCPIRNQVNACEIEADPGNGNNQVTRWHYNGRTGTCESFLYKGIAGNKNNFLTHDQCVKMCGGNPCGSGKPLRISDKNLQCGKASFPTCPMNYYCHVGSSEVNTVCCPKQGNPCTLPMNPGTGSDQLQRYFFDSASKKCQFFMYTGLGGNENNFINEADCLLTCQVRRQASSPCGTGQPANSGRGQIVYCSTTDSNSCPTDYFCHIGTGPETTVCCPMSGANDVCTLPLSTGRGNVVLARWYYDASSSICKPFTYTGIGGNENNFLSVTDCRTICPEFENPCPAGRPPLGSDAGQVQYCSVTNPTCPNNYWCHVGSDKQTSVCCPFSVSPCNLPKVEGAGNTQLPRYYFDKVLKQCRPFLYSGKRGNQNNFISKSDCEAACPIVDNPCAEGMPAFDSSGQPQFCSTANPDMCSDTYWCHIGPSASTTLCCPGAADPCRMPMSKGSGTSVLNRWYYNTDTKTCLSFTYSGRNGNQNNFLSLGECRVRCPEFQNPCSTGQPHISLSGQITHCGATTPSLCPTTFWCHIGATLESSVCCPGAGNPCELSLSEGNGNSNLVRYHYDSDAQICRQFQYSGMGGNENNFLSALECEQRCPVFRNPCSTGEPARDRHTHVIPCSVSDITMCPRNFWCHIGADEQSTLCCPGAEFPCTETLQVGNGAFSLPRFYYNSLTQQCLPFTYSGTGGNQNNYLSRADCEKSCPVFVNPCSQGQPATGPNGQYVVCTATTPNVCPANYWCHVGDLSTNSVCCPGDEIPCVLPLSTGNGNAALTRWYFDNAVRHCTRFTYSGMGGNPNNFLTLQDCQLRCPEYQNPCTVGDPAQSESGGIMYCSTSAPSCPPDYWCHVGSDPDNTICCLGDSNPCTQPMLPGNGNAKLNRWYFNQNTKQCLQFTYTGSRGNQNNFFSESECIDRCPTFKNPCGTNLHPGHIVFCTSQNKDVCPAGYWCHIGIDAEDSVCCPGAGDPCTLDISQGTFTGSQPVVRWHFEKKDKKCKQFQYAGVAGNQNNFLTQQECQQKCPEFVNPCLKGEPYREQQSGLVRYCSRNNPTDCPAQFWCHFGANSQSTVCCPGAGDPCVLPLSIGNGPASLPRWYFNVINRQCQQFTYSGISGNQNNFVTQRECQNVCPEFSNPCSDGTPLTAITGQITYCSAQNPNICPVKYFCHVGTSSESSVCCPTTGDACNLPRLVGRGSSALQRWYFNSLTRRCESFTYSGAGGNANNFVTMETCRTRCQEFNNPCEGEPYRAASGEIVFCNEDSVCPPRHFCHYGIDSTSTMCCPTIGNENPCNLPVVIGAGTSKLTRWYFNVVTKACVTFVYSGLGGNENNFRSQSECDSRCSPIPNPCSPGTSPFMDGTGSTPQCATSTGASGMNGLDQEIFCPTGYYCHVGANPSTTLCCPMQGNPCDLPQSIGNGPAMLQRWYYDRFAGFCQMFTYTGLGGNANNFLSEYECHRQCSAGHLPRQSSKNNSPSSSIKCPHGEPVLSVLGLPQLCVVKPQGPRCPPNFQCTVSTSNDGICCPDSKVYCMQPWQPGASTCATRISAERSIRFGYNPQADSCYPFRYSGCGGNLNNFPSLKSCMEICSSKKSFEKEDSSDIVTLNDDNSADLNSNVTDLHFNNTKITEKIQTENAKNKSVGWLQSMLSWFRHLSRKSVEK